MIFYLLKWWYGDGWLGEAKKGLKRLNKYFDYFSIDILLRTMFAPWKQTVTRTIGDESLDAHIHAAIDNLISRVVGFGVRLFMFIFGIIFMGVIAILLGAFLIFWPLIPILPVGLILWGVQ